MAFDLEQGLYAYITSQSGNIDNASVSPVNTSQNVPLPRVVYVTDHDNIRHTLSATVGYTTADVVIEVHDTDYDQGRRIWEYLRDAMFNGARGNWGTDDVSNFVFIRFCRVKDSDYIGYEQIPGQDSQVHIFRIELAISY